MGFGRQVTRGVGAYTCHTEQCAEATCVRLADDALAAAEVALFAGGGGRVCRCLLSPPRPSERHRRDRPFLLTCLSTPVRVFSLSFFSETRRLLRSLSLVDVHIVRFAQC